MHCTSRNQNERGNDDHRCVPPIRYFVTSHHTELSSCAIFRLCYGRRKKTKRKKRKKARMKKRKKRKEGEEEGEGEKEEDALFQNK